MLVDDLAELLWQFAQQALSSGAAADFRQKLDAFVAKHRGEAPDPTLAGVQTPAPTQTGPLN